MTDDELKDYRYILENEYSDKDLEIQTTLSYVTIGALGFFITINDHFLELPYARFKAVLIISLLLLFLSFILILVRKSKTMRHSLKMMFFVDKMRHEPETPEEGLRELWDKSNKVLTLFRNLTYISLSAGIGLQILFFVLNLS